MFDKAYRSEVHRFFKQRYSCEDLETNWKVFITELGRSVDSIGDAELGFASLLSTCVLLVKTVVWLAWLLFLAILTAMANLLLLIVHSLCYITAGIVDLLLIGVDTMSSAIKSFRAHENAPDLASSSNLDRHANGEITITERSAEVDDGLEMEGDEELGVEVIPQG